MTEAIASGYRAKKLVWLRDKWLKGDDKLSCDTSVGFFIISVSDGGLCRSRVQRPWTGVMLDAEIATGSLYEVMAAAQTDFEDLLSYCLEAA